jgi:hypothetical protein
MYTLLPLVTSDDPSAVVHRVMADMNDFVLTYNAYALTRFSGSIQPSNNKMSLRDIVEWITHAFTSTVFE